MTLSPVEPESFEAGGRPAGPTIESEGETKSGHGENEGEKQDTGDAAKNTRSGKERKTTRARKQPAADEIFDDANNDRDIRR